MGDSQAPARCCEAGLSGRPGTLHTVGPGAGRLHSSAPLCMQLPWFYLLSGPEATGLWGGCPIPSLAVAGVPALARCQPLWPGEVGQMQ